jgi:hypothetical protein
VSSCSLVRLLVILGFPQATAQGLPAGASLYAKVMMRIVPASFSLERYQILHAQTRGKFGDLGDFRQDARSSRSASWAL